MNVWCHLPTIISRRFVFRLLAITAVIVALTTTLLLSSLAFATTPSSQSANQTIGFQGRLMDAGGAVVDDGYYNIQFRIYEGGTGTVAGNPGGALRWTETYTNTNGQNSGVKVTNGYFSVNLGSKTAFGGSVDWNQSTLWLSMNVAGNAANCSVFGNSPCTADGEMLPMKRMTAAPFAMNAGALNGRTASDFVQLGKDIQIDNSNGRSSIAINKTGEGDLLQLQSKGKDIFRILQSGSIQLAGSDDKAIIVGAADDGNDGAKLSLQAGGSGTGTGGTLSLMGGSGATAGGTVEIAGGDAANGGPRGLVILGNTAFSTVQDDASCFTDGKNVADSCTVSQSSVDNSSAVIVGFSTTGKSVTLPDPTTTTAGRVLYLTASSDTKDFTLAINAARAASSIAVQKTQTITLIWNGTDWTVSGATVINDNQQASDEAATPKRGSMYFDTSLGKIQCYEEGGWSDCVNRPDVFVTLAPEYAGAVTNGDGIGELTTDFCSDTLGINNGSDGTAFCGTNETYNFYDWTSDQTTAQEKSIFVTYQLPENFASFAPNSTSLMARSDGDNANVSYTLYRNTSGGLVTCGDSMTASGAASTWQQATASGANDPSSCGFAAGDSIVVEITLTASSGGHASASTLGFTYRTR